MQWLLLVCLSVLTAHADPGMETAAPAVASPAPVLLDKTQEEELEAPNVRAPGSTLKEAAPAVPEEAVPGAAMPPEAAISSPLFLKNVQSISDLDEALKTETPEKGTPGKKVVLYFSSTKRCPPCQQLAPYALRFAEEKKDTYSIYYVDTTEIMGATPNPPTESFQKLSKFFYKFMKQGKLPNVAVLNFSETESPPWVPEPFQVGRALALFKNGLSADRRTAALDEENEIKLKSGGDGKLAAPDATASLKRILELRP